jgi:hypothetical protein
MEQEISCEDDDYESHKEQAHKVQDFFKRKQESPKMMTGKKSLWMHAEDLVSSSQEFS